MEIIELNSYNEDEKFHIARDYLIPKQIGKHGLTAGNLKIEAPALSFIISGYTREAGVRNLEREIAKICRKTAKKVALEGKKRNIVTERSLSDYIGPPKYLKDEYGPADEVGVAHGLAWTSVGGELLNVEVNVVEGTGKVELTGHLGEIMKESAYAAISYIRAGWSSLTSRGIFTRPAISTSISPKGPCLRTDPRPELRWRRR
jgi:ATP-dependent Lon protease